MKVLTPNVILRINSIKKIHRQISVNAKPTWFTKHKIAKTLFRRGCLDSGQQIKSKVKTTTLLYLKTTKEGSSYCITHYKTPLYKSKKYDLIGNIRAIS